MQFIIFHHSYILLFVFYDSDTEVSLRLLRVLSLKMFHDFFFLELFFGTKILIKGDKVPKDEATLIIMNHRCRLDWMFYFMVLLRNGNLRNEKIILRGDLKLVPGPGQCNKNSPKEY